MSVWHRDRPAAATRRRAAADARAMAADVDAANTGRCFFFDFDWTASTRDADVAAATRSVAAIVRKAAFDTDVDAAARGVVGTDADTTRAALADEAAHCDGDRDWGPSSSSSHFSINSSAGMSSSTTAKRPRCSAWVPVRANEASTGAAGVISSSSTAKRPSCLVRVTFVGVAMRPFFRGSVWCPSDASVGRAKLLRGAVKEPEVRETAAGFVFTGDAASASASERASFCCFC